MLKTVCHRSDSNFQGQNINFKMVTMIFKLVRVYSQILFTIFTCTVFLSSFRNTSGSLGEREMLWEHEPHASVPQLFRVLPNFHECFYNSIGTQRTCFLFLLEKRKSTCLLWSSKFSLLAPSLGQQLLLVGVLGLLYIV